MLLELELEVISVRMLFNYRADCKNSGRGEVYSPLCANGDCQAESITC